MPWAHTEQTFEAANGDGGEDGGNQSESDDDSVSGEEEAGESSPADRDAADHGSELQVTEAEGFQLQLSSKSNSGYKGGGTVICGE